MMKPLADLRRVRSCSSTSLSLLTSSGSAVPVQPDTSGNRLRAGSAAFALLCFALAATNAIAQQPTPIPNWVPTQPAASGQYGPSAQANGQNQQYGYGYGSQQQPQYQQPPDQYGQPQYQQPPDDNDVPDPSQLQAYGDVPDPGYAPPYQPQQVISPDRLEQMVAPIALYPDNLVSIILAASTYPAQVVGADQWLHAQGGAPPEQIAAGATAQTSWDPSVKALTAFPQVLDQMAQSLQWTTDLGNAYYNQPQDVMQTIQVMRGRAQAAGNLQSTPQQDVVVDQGNIAIAPPTPQIVYVPQYDPWVVYGQPVNPYPGFNWVVGVGGFVGNAFVSWGPGIAMDAFAITPFGWLGWGLDWFAHSIYFGNDIWCTHSHSVHDWGFAHGGGRYWGNHGEMARWRERGGWGGHGGVSERGGWNRAFRSGLDRGRFAGGGRSEPRFGGGGERGGFSGNYGHGGNGGSAWGRGSNGYGGQSHDHNGSGNGYGYGGRGNNGSGNGYGGQNGGGAWAHNGNGQGYGRNGNTYGGNGYNMPRGGNYTTGGAGGHVQNGFGFGRGDNGGGGHQGSSPSPGYQSYNHAPQAIGGPQMSRGYGSAEQGRSGGYGYPSARAFSNNYGRQNGGASSPGSRPLPNYGIRPGFGGSYAQTYRTPASNYGGSRSYTPGNGSGSPYGNHAYAYGGSSIARAPAARGFGSFSGGRSNGGYSYGGGSFRAPKAPSYSSHSFGGGSHFGGGGSSHFSSHSFGGSGGGGHFGGGGGHSSGGHSGGGGHGGGGHHR